MRRSSPPCRTQRSHFTRLGAAAVEMAIVAPLFLLLLGGIIEFGQVYYAKHVVATAARR